MKANQHVTYRTFPPVSGVHNPTPAIWGDYSEPVHPRMAVHNEEHGGMIVWYGSKVSSKTRQQITDFYQQDPNGILVTPIQDSDRSVTYPSHAPLGSKIALTAWYVPNRSSAHDVIAVCPAFSEPAFKAFRDTFRGKGPERVPVKLNKPGT